jgi:hypothetical protein
VGLNQSLHSKKINLVCIGCLFLFGRLKGPSLRNSIDFLFYVCTVAFRIRNCGTLTYLRVTLMGFNELFNSVLEIGVILDASKVVLRPGGII